MNKKRPGIARGPVPDVAESSPISSVAKWIVGSGGAIALAFIAWLALEVIKLGRDLSALNASVETGFRMTEERVDRIAGALPELGRIIAQDALSSPLSGAVVTRTPTKSVHGAWITLVDVIGPDQRKQWSYELEMDDGRRDAALLMVTGLVKRKEPAAFSFTQMKSWSTQVGDAPAPLPANIELDSSFVLRGSSVDEIRGVLTTMGSLTQEKQLQGDLDEWKLLAEELKR